jgi:hypothetical protein
VARPRIVRWNAANFVDESNPSINNNFSGSHFSITRLPDRAFGFRKKEQR